MPTWDQGVRGLTESPRCRQRDFSSYGRSCCSCAGWSADRGISGIGSLRGAAVAATTSGSSCGGVCRPMNLVNPSWAAGGGASGDELSSLRNDSGSNPSATRLDVGWQTGASGTPGGDSERLTVAAPPGEETGGGKTDAMADDPSGGETYSMPARFAARLALERRAAMACGD